MNNNFEIKALKLTELTAEEAVEINGGDKFLHDVGYAVGAAAGWLWEQTETMRAFGGSAA